MNEFANSFGSDGRIAKKWCRISFHGAHGGKLAKCGFLHFPTWLKIAFQRPFLMLRLGIFNERLRILNFVNGIWPDMLRLISARF